MFLKDIGLKFSFLVMSLCGFVIRTTLASQNELENVPSFIFLKSLYRIGIIPFLNVCQNSPVKPSGSGVFFISGFLKNTLFILEWF